MSFNASENCVVKESKGIWQKYCAVICLNAAVKIALEGGFCPNISGARSVHREVKSFCLWTREGAVLLSSGVSPTTDYYCSTHIEHLFVLSQRLAVAQTIYRILYLCVFQKSDFLVCATLHPSALLYSYETCHILSHFVDYSGSNPQGGCHVQLSMVYFGWLRPLFMKCDWQEALQQDQNKTCKLV